MARRSAAAGPCPGATMTDIPRRPHCDRCALPLRTCICALAARVDNDIDVLVLQHPAEAREAKGSVRLLSLSLARCQVVVGEAFEPAALLALLGGDVSGSALLYPSDTGARAAGAEATPLPARPRRLVLLDGTWRQSAGMLRANALLQSLPRWAISPAAPTRYRALRKAPRATHLSTLEAACAALADVEAAPARYAPLLDAFERFVAQGAARAGRTPAPR
jgi:DTW domain-containing protein YfiP